jgi:uncharacterized protein YggT (Ycf19 family)
MAYDEERVVTRREEGMVDRTTAPGARSYSERTVTRRPSGAETVRRLIIFIFGLIQGLIILRIVLLLVAARQGNDLVSFIYNVSDIFVAPFRGILRISEVSSGAVQLDISAIVALIGWTILEFVIIALVNVFRREPG